MRLMSFSQAIFLAIIQGLTEFLPISSSAHLVIFQKFFGLEPPVLFDILVHLGTLGAVILFFREELLRIIKGVVRGNISYINILYKVGMGTIPAVIVGLFLQNYIQQIFNSLKLVGVALLVTAGLLMLSRRFKLLNRQFSDLNWRDAFLVGIFQALAILPGVSRSGATIVSGLWRKLNRRTAFYFSFYLAIPAILGALALQIPDLVHSTGEYLVQGIIGMVIAGVVGCLALTVLKRVLFKGKLWYFGLYCFGLGLLLLLTWVSF